MHIHVPAGAIPKDGPSAGVAMFVALVSLLTGRTARSDTAMTGEISLRGLVLPIGGVKEKVLAAVRAGITTVLLPARNRKDLEDVPEEARKHVRFVWLERVDDAVAAVLEIAAPAPQDRKPSPRRRLRPAAGRHDRSSDFQRAVSVASWTLACATIRLSFAIPNQSSWPGLTRPSSCGLLNCRRLSLDQQRETYFSRRHRQRMAGSSPAMTKEDV